MKPFHLFLILLAILMAGNCIAGCTTIKSPSAQPAVTTVPATAGTSPIYATTSSAMTTVISSPQTAACSDIQTSGPGALKWISEAPANSSGAGLLSGAKALMMGIYTYSPGSPDYLPTSYTDQKTQLTGYTLHAKDETSVYWVTDHNSQLQWVSEPGGTPRGWSGIITLAGPVATGTETAPHCFTDCSGFITSLFTYANTLTPTKFTVWKKGGSVPLAGCHDPQGSCTDPNPLNYYNLFTSGKEGGFKIIPLEDLQPGDLIAYSDTKDKSNSGHIMLVAAVSSCTGDPMSRFVVVIDVTGSPHSYDTRPVKVLPSGEKTGAGLGMGIIRLSGSPQNTLEFYWGLRTTSPQTGSIALGRAL